MAPEKLPTEGIATLTPEVLADARELGYRVKLLALARRQTAVDADEQSNSNIDARVHPVFIPTRHPLSTVPEAQNSIRVSSDALGNTLYQGPGAGGLPTGSAVVADLIAAAKNLRAGIAASAGIWTGRGSPKLLRPQDAMSGFYVRLVVADEPGVLAHITKIFARHHVSLATVLQREQGIHAQQPVAVVLCTHPTTFGAVEKALRAIRKLAALREEVHVIPIEDTGA